MATEHMLEMFDADPADMVNSVDDLVGRASPTSDGDNTSLSSQSIKKSPKKSPKEKKQSNSLPAVNWDKLFMTGNLNVDEHIDKLKAAKERRRKLMDFAKVENKKDGSAPKTLKKDPFKSYSARRTSINPADGVQYIDKLMIEMKISPR